MKKTLLIALLFCSQALFAAKPSTPYVLSENYQAKYIGTVSEKEWVKRGKNGQIVITYSDGTTLTKNYLAAKLNGKTIYSYPHTNTPKVTEEYEDDILVSKSEHFSSGLKEIEKEYSNGSVIKISKWYFDGSPASVEEYKANFLVSATSFMGGIEEAKVHEGQGTLIQRDCYGILISKDTIAAGEVAEKAQYYCNGELKQITPYYKGQIHGQVKTYLAGGQPLSIEEWRNGQKNGTTFYFENGAVTQSIPFTDGKKHGLELHYQDHMKVVQEISWKKGKRHGQQITFVNGQAHEEWFHEDKSVNKLTYNILNLPSQKS
jgi:antitoxin component YwqK of YwqJK toxin-antitoxin module